LKDISASIKKVDLEDKCSGNARYVSDIRMDNLHYARTLRSTIAKGKITSIAYPKIDGVFVVDASDIPGKNVVKIIFDDQAIFPVNEVTYIGEPIALIVGKNLSDVEQFIRKTVITFEEEVPLFDWTESDVHYHYTKGNLDKAKQNAVRVIHRDYQTGYQEQAYIEPQGFVGTFENGKITLHGSIQCPYYVKNAVIAAMNISGDDIRVIQESVGGAFGGKEEFPSLLACELAVALKKLQVPIKLIYEREEDMISSTKRHPSKTKMTAYVSKDNRILGIEASVGIDGGANIGLSGVVLSRALIAVTGAYTIDHLDVTGDVYLTNTVPNGAFRGFGAPQMLFAIEMFIEHIAKEIGIDPIILRQNHLAKQNDRTSTNGTFRDPIILPQMILKALEASNYHKKVKEYTTHPQFKGIGMSYFLHGCGFTGSGEATHIKAKVRLKKHKDGIVEILIAAVDMGQGVRTTMRKVVAQVLEIDVDRVIYPMPDTDFVPDSGPTVASRTMMIVGGLIARCALKLKDHMQEDTEIVMEENFVQPEYIRWDEQHFQGDAYPAYSWGVNIVEVSVDPNSYEVSIDNITSVYDLGKAIDERVVMGQADGGITQGVAYGYLEVMEHKNGKLKQKNFTDYIIPTARDVGKMQTFLMDNPYPLGPYGAKGVGELTLVGGAPAVAKAIEMAIGKEVHEIPMTPEKIMELMNHED